MEGFIKHTTGKIGTAICDANVLIDLANADCAIIAEIVAYCGKVYVPDLVFREVYNLDEKTAADLGLILVDTPEPLERIPGLSQQDRSCLWLVAENGWACISNDKRLRKECQKTGGKVYWGLEILLLLVEAKLITKKRAETAAKEIRVTNFEMGDNLLDDFLKKMSRL